MQDSTSLATAADTFFRGGGEMAALTRAMDWSATPLRPVETWTTSLRTTVSTLPASRIDALSAPGEGTTMELYCAVATAGAPAAAADRGSAAVGRSRPGRGRMVLVADDEPLVRTLAVRALEEEGYDVLAVEDGAAALELLERDDVRPDLIITDVIMPRRKGRQLHDAVTARWPGFPVLFMSGHTGEEAVLQRLVPRGAPFLQKPFSPETLARAAAELLAARSRRG